MASPGAAAAGTTTPTCQGETATIVGTDADDTLVGTPDDDVIVGLAGNDTIRGLGGNDLICADADGDRKTSRHDVLDGGLGNDTLVGEYRYYGLANGGAGDDKFVDTGVTYADAPRAVTVDLEAGTADGWGHDTFDRVGIVHGTRYDDNLTGLAQNVEDSECGCDYLYGAGGDDVLKGLRGDDFLYGGHGDDSLNGGLGSDTLYPGLGQDRVVGGPAGDRATSYRPDDVSYAPLRRSVHIDLRSGTATGQGRDRLVRIGRAEGSGAADVIDGNGGENRILGGGGNDVIRGRAGRDFLFGQAGRDRLIGGPNHDFVDGGAGEDTCHAEKQQHC